MPFLFPKCQAALSETIYYISIYTSPLKGQHPLNILSFRSSPSFKVTMKHCVFPF